MNGLRQYLYKELGYIFMTLNYYLNELKAIEILIKEINLLKFILRISSQIQF